MALNAFKCSVGLCFMLFVATLFGQPLGWSALGPWNVLWLALSGVVGLSLGDSFYLRSLSTIGPRKTLLLWSLSPPLTAVLGALFLDEPLTWMRVSGIALAIGGVVFVARERSGGIEPPLSLLGASFGLLAALCQSGGSLLVRLGGENTDAVTISIARLSAAVPVLLVMVAASGAWRRSLRAVRDPAGYRPAFMGSFLGTFLGFWCSMIGLRYADIGVAATLGSMSPIFVLPLSALWLREHVSARAVMGAVIAVGGVALLVLGGCSSP
jgi:drug/metabolite transporter (DMT)-like permease